VEREERAMKTRSWMILLSLAALAAAPARATAVDEKLYAGVAAAIKASFTPGFDRVGELKKVYQVLRLIDADGRFAVLAFDKRGLLDDFDPAAFVDRMVHCAATNAYLNDFMKKAVAAHLSFGNAPDRAAVLAAATTYAVALDRITRLVRNDWHLLQALHDRYQAVRASGHFVQLYKQKLTTFEQAKMATIDYGILRLLTVQREHKVPPALGRESLPINIAEAGLEDLREHNLDNAHVAATLLFAQPEIKKHDPRTQSRFGKDGKAILYALPLPKQWVDLYETWNMAFVSTYPNAPYFYAKLFTPQVICYQAEPEEFIYNRAISLYLHIQFEVLRRVDAADADWKAQFGGHPPDPAEMSWKDAQLVKLWGATNRASARAFEKDLHKHDGGWFKRAKTDVTNLELLLKQLPADVKDLIKLFKERKAAGM
jgi:hypothetical protein